MVILDLGIYGKINYYVINVVIIIECRDRYIFG